MEFGGNGGLQGSHSLPQPNSGMEVPDISMELPAQMNQSINNNSSGDNSEYAVREQDCFMPMANVVRIMRKILPPHAKISDDTKEAMQECVSEFISFVTGEANDRCQQEQRKTITPEDILWAMSNLGFDDYIEPLTRYLHRYREHADGERVLERGEPSMQRTTEPVNYGIPTFAPAFAAHHHGFFGPAPAPTPMTGFLNDPSGAGPSRVAVPNFEPFARAAQMTGFLKDPSGAGPSQVAMTNLEPFAQAAPMTGFLKDPSGAGPSQVAVPNLEPFPQDKE